MPSNKASFDALLAAVSAAILSGDLTTANTQALAAQALAPTLVDSNHDETELRHAAVGQVSDLLTNIRRAQAGSAGVQRTKVTYARATD